MKKHYTHFFTFLLITLTNLSFAQVDWAIKSIKSPTELRTKQTSNGPKANLELVVECEKKRNTNHKTR